MDVTALPCRDCIVNLKAVMYLRELLLFCHERNKTKTMVRWNCFRCCFIFSKSRERKVLPFSCDFPYKQWSFQQHCNTVMGAACSLFHNWQQKQRPASCFQNELHLLRQRRDVFNALTYRKAQDHILRKAMDVISIKPGRNQTWYI